MCPHSLVPGTHQSPYTSPRTPTMRTRGVTDAPPSIHRCASANGSPRTTFEPSVGPSSSRATGRPGGSRRSRAFSELNA